MYCIHESWLDGKQFEIIGFVETMDEAKEKIISAANDYIIFEEGAKKLKSVWYETSMNLENLKDGFYLANDEKRINVLKKSTIKVNNGWIFNSELISHKIEIIKYFGIREIDKKLINNCIMQKEIASPDIKTINHINKSQPAKQTTKSIDIGGLLLELQKNGFKPGKTKYNRKNLKEDGNIEPSVFIQKTI
jgi:hypothetical protein